jgi:beta-phosphoglucomutase-like phosphatase (HAD superfamily)
METAPSDCLVLEDAHKGILAARNGGFPVVLVENWQNRNLDHQDLCIADGIPQFLKILDQLKGRE